MSGKKMYTRLLVKNSSTIRKCKIREWIIIPNHLHGIIIINPVGQFMNCPYNEFVARCYCLKLLDFLK